MHTSIWTCMSYYPRHVSGLNMPILRRNNCTNIASGILALLSGCTLHRLIADWSPLSTGVVYSRLEERGYQMLCLCSCSSWGWACQGPKHVEEINMTYMFILKCAIKLVERNNPILWCTVEKTSIYIFLTLFSVVVDTEDSKEYAAFIFKAEVTGFTSNLSFTNCRARHLVNKRIV